MYKPVQKKSSSWTPASVQKKSKSLKSGSKPIQPKRENKSSQQSDIPNYSRGASDGIMANVMRSLEAKEQEQQQTETPTVQPQPVSGGISVADVVQPMRQMPIPQIGMVSGMLPKNPIQRLCWECAAEQQEQSSGEKKDVDEISFGTIQTKLTIGAPGDVYEQEADHVARQVMSMPDSSPQVQRFSQADNSNQIWQRALSITPVMRQVDEQVQMHPLVQRAFFGGENQASGDLEGRLNASKGGGSPLSEEVRGFMEPRFGADFSSVRVHTGAESVQMNRELGAQAFTHERDIFFGEGKEPGNNELTAHELTHVVQQTSSLSLQKQPDNAADKKDRQRLSSSSSEMSAILQRMNQLQMASTQSPVSDTIPRDVIQMPPETIHVGMPGNAVPQTGVVQRQTQGSPESSTATDRYKQVHKNLFIDQPGTGSQSRQPWSSQKKSEIIEQAKDGLKARVDDNPHLVIDYRSVQSTEAEADKEAIIVDRRIHKRFPSITKTFTEEELKDAVTVNKEGQIMGEKFVHDWVESRLPTFSDVEEYDLKPGSPDYEEIIKTLQSDTKAFDFSKVLQKYTLIIKEAYQKDDLTFHQAAKLLDKGKEQLKGKNWGWVWAKNASNVPAYHETSPGGTERKIFIHPYHDDDSRLVTLIHEFMHFYTHNNFKKWVNKTTTPTFYEEGFTEFLARQVMTPDELSRGRSYQDQFKAVRDEVAAHVSVDDIEMAYFHGEVWRLEGTSEVAKNLFKDKIGLDLDASRGDEVKQSKTSEGIVQTATSGKHYRFMNLAVGGVEPKPEHRSAFESLYNQYVKDKPSVKIRFVGHTDTTGSKWFNVQLSKKRATAFYQMAKDIGVPSSQLGDAKSPQGKSSEDLNVDDNDVYGRAFNRRVEMFIETL